MKAYEVRSVRIGRVDRDTAALYFDVHDTADGDDTLELIIGRKQVVTLMRDILNGVLQDWAAE